MRKILFIGLFLITMAGFKYAFCQDNLLAVDKIDDQQKPLAVQDEALPQNENSNKALEPGEEEAEPVDESEQELKEIKAYRETLETKQKELGIIRLDLEKSNLLLKKKTAEKEIYQIDQALPQGKAENTSLSGPLSQGLKEPLVDSSDIRIQLLVIADNLKEGQISLKGFPYSFKEGDCIAAKLTVEQIEPSGVTFRQTDGSVLKLNFIN